MDFNAPLPGILKPLNSVRSEDHVQVEGAVPELKEDFPAANFFCLLVAQREQGYVKSFPCRVMLYSNLGLSRYFSYAAL